MNRHLKDISRRRHGTGAVWSLVAALLCMLTAARVAAATSSTSYELVSRQLLTELESCPNGAIDPGETNTVRFAIKKKTDGTHENVRVELVPGSGVEFTIDTFSAGNVSKDNQFNADVRFRADATCGDTVTPKIRVSWKNGDGRSFEEFSADGSDNKGPFRTGATVTSTYTFPSASAIVINDFNTASDKLGRATPYGSGAASISPSGVPNQSGVTGERVSKIIVTLNGVTHPYAQDLNVVVESPWGQRFALMKQAGGINPLNGANITFDSDASASLPAVNSISSGVYKPADYNTTEKLPDLTGDYTTNLKAAAIADGETGSKNPNAAWRLYVQDDTLDGSGQIAGWSLQLVTTRIDCCNGGATGPTITQTRNGVSGEAVRLPGISNIEINEDQKDRVVFFNVRDLETSAGNLTVTAVSSDQNLIKDSNLVIEGGNNTDNKKLTIKNPEANRSGTTAITVTVTDASGKAVSTAFNVTIKPLNDAPTVSEILGQASNPGVSTLEVPFTVSDVESDSGVLALSVTSDNATLVPPANVFIRGTGSSRTVQITPANNNAGSATIRITATDPDGGSGFAEFKVSFETDPGDPTITPLTDRTIKEDESLTRSLVVRSFSSTTPGNLEVTAVSSSDLALVPLNNIVITGNGSDRTVTITPASNRNGQSTIRLRVTDPIDRSTRWSETSFLLKVDAVNDAPTISEISNQSINEDSVTGDIVFTVSDVDSTVSSTVAAGGSAPDVGITVTSQNTQLIPQTGISLTINTDGTRVLRLTPAANAFGRAGISVTATDGDKSFTRTFNVTVNPVNDAPDATTVNLKVPNTNDEATLAASNVANGDLSAAQTVDMNEDSNLDGNGNPATSEIEISGITPGPGENTDQTATVGVGVTVNSDKITDLSLSSASLNNSTTTTRIKFKVAKHFDGDAVFTIRLTDNEGSVTEKKFKLDLIPDNDNPDLADIADRTVSASTTGFVVPISISDVETRTPVVSVVATASGPNAGLISQLVVDPAKTQISVVPNTTALASATLPADVTINVTITDRGALDDGNGTETDTDSFNVRFADVRPPTLTLTTPTTLTIVEDSVASATIKLSDDQAASAVTLSARSSNESLVSSDGNGILFSRAADPAAPADNKRQEVTVIVVPNLNKNSIEHGGDATITIVATDANQLDTSVSFKVSVTPVENQPTISVVKSTASGTAWTGSTLVTKEDTTPVKDDKTSSKLIEVTVADPETSANNLVVTATGVDAASKAIVPDANISVSSTGGTRTITVNPAKDMNGNATIRVTVRDNAGKTATSDFTVQFDALNDEPTFDVPADLTLTEDAPQRTITLNNVSVGPANEAGQTLKLTVTAKDEGKDSNSVIDTSVLPTESATTGSFTLKLLPHASGVSIVSVKMVDDGANGNGHDNERVATFKVTVNSENDAPLIFLRGDSSQAEKLEYPTTSGVATQPIPIEISDAEANTPIKLNDLVLTVQSDNQELVPNANLELSGSVGKFGLIAKPVAGKFGTANITITVTDKGQPEGSNVKSASKVAKVIVDAGNAPLISRLDDVTIHVNEDSPILTFTVSDAQSAASLLTVTPSVDNTALVPLGNIQFGGTSTGSRQMIIRPANNQAGTARITLTVKDPDNNTSSMSFNLIVLGEPPTISAIANKEVARNGTTGSIPFTINDDRTFPGLLSLTAKSSNPTFVPEASANIAFGGSGQNRTITVTPATDKVGSSTITIIVTDSEGQTNSTKFVVSTPDNTEAPTISSIANQTAGVGQPTGVIAFTVGDKETAAASLVVRVESSNKTLVPDGNVFVGGTGANRTVLISPAANQTGESTITITVTDADGKSASTSFKVTVGSNAAPTVSGVSNQTIDKNGVATVTVTVGDTETAAGQLVLTGTSSSQTLVPNANILVSGTGSNRSVAITPANGATGTTTITLTVTDGGNKTASTSFTLTVNATASSKGDIDGDGKADLVFQDGDGFLAVWTADSDKVTGANYLSPSNVGDLSYRIAGSGDFNRDGKEDLLFQSTSGNLAVWYMNGGSQVDAAVLNPSSTGDTNWKVVGVGDFNRDGKADIALQHTDGTLGVWFMDGVNLSSAALIEPSNPGDAAWKVAGVGDLNGDGRQDLVFQHTDGTLACWNLNGANGVTVSTAALMNPSFAGDAAWRVVGVCDRNGDGKADLLFQHSDSSLAIWYMNGATVSSAKMLNPSTPGGSWKVVAPR